MQHPGQQAALLGTARHLRRGFCQSARGSRLAACGHESSGTDSATNCKQCRITTWVRWPPCGRRDCYRDADGTAASCMDTLT
eukprot:scaffold1130_cov195-Pinguiococcus_pyrenoidosus.AAC.42